MKFSALLGAIVAAVLCTGAQAYPPSILAPPEVAALCPNPPGRYPLLLSNPTDCGSFYMCSWNNVAYLQHCPLYLHFNPALQVCDSPAHFTCVVSTTQSTVTNKTTPAPIIETTPAPVSNITSLPDFNSTVPVVNGTSAPSRQVRSVMAEGVVTAPPEVAALCPNPPGKYPLLLPNPTDCRSFYMCSWNGVAFLQHCPPVLQFNPALQVCDSPEHFKCVVSTPVPVTTERTPEPTIKTTPGTVPNVTFVPDLNSTFPVVNGTSATPSQVRSLRNSKEEVVTAPPEVAAQCPSFSPERVAMIPDPNNCANFYMCLATGSAILRHCPSDLLFNPSLQVCDFPHNVECHISG